MSELLSPSTRKEDLGDTEAQPNSPPTKWQVYEHILGVPYYILFDRYTDELKAFQLVGSQYEELVLAPKVWVPELKLGLGLWSGDYAGIPRLWLRWYNEQGEWVLTEAEEERRLKEEERRLKEEERRLKDQERRLREELIAKLIARGIDPDSL